MKTLASAGKPTEMILDSLHKQQSNRLVLALGLACGLWASTLGGVYGQAPGGGAGGGMPAFSEPTFRERLYEAGGIADREVHNGKRIVEVSIEGNQTVSDSYILAQMQSREDRPFDKETFNRDMGALYRTNLFRKIDSYIDETPEGVRLRLIISERPIIRSVEFLGNERMNEGPLKKHAMLSKGDALDPISVNSARGRLVELYKDKGMNQVDIQVVKGLKPGERDVHFLINEGPVERINSIAFFGNSEFGSDLLKARIKSRDARSGLTKYIGNICSDLKLDEDRETLLGYYRALGYFDAKVDYQKSYNIDGDFVDVAFVIYEGERYSVASVSIAGTERYNADELLPSMKLKADEPFLLNKKLQDERFLLDVYGAQGHIFCEVDGEVIYQPDQHKVDIVYKVKEGDVYRASDIRVHIDGDFTRRHVVLQPLRNLRPGEVIDKRELDNGKRRLFYSTIFNTDPSRGEVPRIEVSPVDDPSLQSP
jgi:outer membrane protein insertion porin family